MKIRLNNKYINFAIKSMVSFGLLFLGGSIYILFRPKSLQMFNWIDNLGLTNLVNRLREDVSELSLGHITLYSLPDGLWLASYIIMVNAIVPKEHKSNLLFWSFLLPAIAIVFEILQIPGIICGVFDIYDLICYLIPLIINVIYLKYEKVI
jgi:hypothetical protein